MYVGEVACTAQSMGMTSILPLKMGMTSLLPGQFFIFCTAQYVVSSLGPFGVAICTTWLAHCVTQLQPHTPGEQPIRYNCPFSGVFTKSNQIPQDPTGIRQYPGPGSTPMAACECWWHSHGRRFGPVEDYVGAPTQAKFCT